MSRNTPRADHHFPGLDTLVGIVRVGCGRADGLTLFGNSPGHFMASLAPFGAMTLVGLLLQPSLDTIGLMLVLWCGWLLGPAVITWELARKWRTEQLWLPYATASNWCLWALPMMGSLLLLTVGMLINLGLSADTASLILPTGLGAYALWLHWFLARSGLKLSRWRAALVVILVNIMTSGLVLLLVLVDWYFGSGASAAD